MKWDEGHESSNVEDVRGQGGGGGGGGFPIGRFGLGGTIILGVLGLIFGRNFLSGSSSHDQGSERGTAEDKRMVSFVSFVLDDAQDNWKRVLPAQTGKQYRDAKLDLFTDDVRSGCGYAESAMGPFYCPADEKVYIDLGFYQALKTKLGAPGDFAQAYVIAHEIGHHVQKILGTEQRVHAQEARMSQADKDALSIRVELQADCYAGVWANSTEKRDLLEKGDIDEAVNAAAAVGDDRLQKSATGHVNPETWTHGSSGMRTRWFKIGLQTGKVDACNTFDAPSLD